MKDEEINRKFDVVADHLAALAVGLERLTEKVDRLSDKVDRTADSVAALLAIAEMHDREINTLGETVRAVDGRQREADERRREADEWRREADERQRLADERLNALINTVERYVSERRNGKSE